MARGYISENGQFFTSRGNFDVMEVEYDPEQYRELQAVALMAACKKVEELARKLDIPRGELKAIYRAAAMIDAGAKEVIGDELQDRKTNGGQSSGKEGEER